MVHVPISKFNPHTWCMVLCVHVQSLFPNPKSVVKLLSRSNSGSNHSFHLHILVTPAAGQSLTLHQIGLCSNTTYITFLHNPSFMWGRGTFKEGWVWTSVNLWTLLLGIYLMFIHEWIIFMWEYYEWMIKHLYNYQTEEHQTSRPYLNREV